MLAKINWRGVFFTPTSTPYKVVENIPMLWISRLIHHHAIITILVGPQNT